MNDFEAMGVRLACLDNYAWEAERVVKVGIGVTLRNGVLYPEWRIASTDRFSRNSRRILGAGETFIAAYDAMVDRVENDRSATDRELAALGSPLASMRRDPR